jgi:leucyl-tRNA synthetase
MDIIERSEGAGAVDEMNEKEREIHRAAHQAIKRVTEDIEDNFHFNTAIAALMEFLNTLSAALADDEIRPAVLNQAASTLVILLSPFSPHMCEELWRYLGHEESTLKKPWPEHDPEAVVSEEVVIVVQVNGKVRSKFTAPVDTSEEELQRLALDDERVKKYTEGKTVRNVFVVPGRLVNIVV